MIILGVICLIVLIVIIGKKAWSFLLSSLYVELFLYFLTFKTWQRVSSEHKQDHSFSFSFFLPPVYFST